MFSFLDAFLSVFRRKQSLLPKVRTGPQPEPSEPKLSPAKGFRKVPLWVVQTEVAGRYVARSVCTYTKSEARAVVKQEFGLSRLPVGTLIQRKV